LELLLDIGDEFCPIDPIALPIFESFEGILFSETLHVVEEGRGDDAIGDAFLERTNCMRGGRTQGGRDPRD